MLIPILLKFPKVIRPNSHVGNVFWKGHIQREVIFVEIRKTWFQLHVRGTIRLNFEKVSNDIGQRDDRGVS